MTNLRILLIFYVIIFLYSIYVAKGNLLYPGIVITGSLLFSVVCACLYSRDMLHSVNGSDLNIKTVALLSLCGGIIALTCNVCCFYANQLSYSATDYTEEYTENEIDDGAVMLGFVFAIIVLVIVVIYFNTNTSGSIISRISHLRYTIRYNKSSLRYFFIVSQIEKLMVALTYVFTFFLAKKMDSEGISCLCEKKYRRIFVIILICLFTEFVTKADRYHVMEILICYIIARYMINKKRNFRIGDFSSFFKYLALGIGVFSLFIIMMPFVGIDIGEYSAFRYIASYAYGGIVHLDYTIDNPASSEYFGKLTLSFLYPWLSRLGLVSTNIRLVEYDSEGEFINTFLGRTNVRTLFGRWYDDFGMIATIIISFAVAVVLSKLYSKMIRSSGYYGDELICIVYVKIVIDMLYAGFDDHLSRYLTPNYILTLLFIVMIYKMITRVKIRLTL